MSKSTAGSAKQAAYEAKLAEQRAAYDAKKEALRAEELDDAKKEAQRAEELDDAGEGEFGDGVTKPLYEFAGSRVKGGRVFTPNVIKVWSDRIEEYEHHALRKKGTQAINFHQVAQVKVGRGLRWSDVSVESTGGHIITLKGVPKADGDKVKNLIDNAVNEVRKGAFVPAPAPAAAATSASVADPAEQLKKLSELHQSGLITDEEFAAKRAVLVDQL